MGWFDKLLGRDAPIEVATNLVAKRGWDDYGEGRGAAATKTYLEEVARVACVVDAQVVPRPEDEATELRGTLKTIPFRIVVGDDGDIDAFALKYATQRDWEPLDLEFDPKMAETPAAVEAWEPSEQRVFVGPQVFFEGGSAKREAAAFRELPTTLQETVVRAIRDLGIRYFRSRRDHHMTTSQRSLRDISDPVGWLVRALILSIDVAVARGARPPTDAPSPPKLNARPDTPSGLAQQLVKRVPGAQLLDRENGDYEVRWSIAGTLVRVEIYSSGRTNADALADGVAGSFDLAFDDDPDDDEHDPLDPWSRPTVRFEFAPDVYLTGDRLDVRAERLLVTGLPGDVQTAMKQAFAAQDVRSIGLDAEMVYTTVYDDLDEVTDGVGRTVRVVELLARIAAALPRVPLE